MRQAITDGRSMGSARVGSVLTLLVAGGVVAFAVTLAAKAVSSDAPGSQIGFEKNLPLMVNAVGLLLVFILFAGLTWHLLSRIGTLRRRNAELGRFALATNKTDNAVLLTAAEGTIEWVNEGFARVSGYLLADALGKQPGTLLLGALQNVTVTQKIREGL